MSDTAIKLRSVTRDEMTEFEQSEWKFAKETVDWYFVPKLMEYEHFRNWYIPNILNWHTPNVIDSGIMLSVEVREEEVHSNDDGGWVARPSNSMEFVLGKDSFIGMNTVYSRASIDRNSDALYHLHIEPGTKSVLVDIVSNPEDEMLRQWLLKHDMHGVVYKRISVNPHTFGPRILLKRFQKDDYLVEMEDPSLIDEPIQVDMIKVTLGLNKHE